MHGLVIDVCNGHTFTIDAWVGNRCFGHMYRVLLTFSKKELYEPRHEKTGVLPMRKQRRRSAVQ